MLERLVVSNLVVIRDADLQFGPGLNVLTGETGAGKTIVTGALDLALGGRTEASLVGPNGRRGVRRGGVRAAAGDAGAGGVRRRPRAGGRGGRAAGARAPRRRPTAAAGRSPAGAPPPAPRWPAAGEELVSVVSQHEARALTRPAVQRALLDGFAGPKQADRLHAMSDAWHGLGRGAPRARRRQSPTRPAPTA